MRSIWTKRGTHVGVAATLAMTLLVSGCITSRKKPMASYVAPPEVDATLPSESPAPTGGNYLGLDGSPTSYSAGQNLSSACGSGHS